MPSIFSFKGYLFYFWSNEYSGNKLEPIHVHVAKNYEKNAPKFWLMKDGTTKIDDGDVNRLTKSDIKLFEETITANRNEVFNKWFEHFGSGEFKEN